MFTVFDIIDERDGHCMWLFCLSVCLSVTLVDCQNVTTSNVLPVILVVCYQTLW